MDRIQLNGVWYIKESLTFKKKYYQANYSITNLDVITYRNGDSIPKVRNPKEWSKLTTGAYCYCDNDPSKGILYNWYAVNDPRGLAPLGWKIPNNKEMDLLDLKINPEFNGFRFYNGEFLDINANLYWWSLSELNEDMAWYLYFSNNSGNVTSYDINKQSGFSVRCIKEDI